MVIILLVLGLVHAERVWQLASDATTTMFPSGSIVPMRIANVNCQDSVLDYTISMWTWHDRISTQKQFFWFLDTSGSLKLFKTLDNRVQATFSVGNLTQTVSVEGLEAKRWELVTMIVSATRRTAMICAGSLETPTNCSHASLILTPPNVSSSKSFVNIGGPMMEIIDAKISMAEWTMTDIQYVLASSRDSGAPYIACTKWDCVPANQNQEACQSLTREVIPGNFTFGEYTIKDYLVSHTSYRLNLQLTVHNGDADLIAKNIASSATWTSKRPGNDFLTLNFYAPQYKVGNTISVIVSAYSEVPAAFTLTVVHVEHVGNTTVARAGVVKRDDVMGEEPQMDIESKDALLGPKDMKSSELAYSMFIAIFVLVGLGVCVCNSKVPEKRRRASDPNSDFVRLDA